MIVRAKKNTINLAWSCQDKHIALYKKPSPIFLKKHPNKIFWMRMQILSNVVVYTLLSMQKKIIHTLRAWLSKQCTVSAEEAEVCHKNFKTLCCKL